MALGAFDVQGWLMTYTVATEGEGWQDGSLLASGHHMSRASREPRGVAHLFSDGEPLTLCGRLVDGLHEFPGIPFPGNYVGLYGCQGCKDVVRNISRPPES